jgi:3-keto-5-aminohexanoate cleavage enzyme
MLLDINELLIKHKVITPPYFINLCIGIHSAVPATLPMLLSMVELIPKDSTWIVTIGGRQWLPLLSAVIALGGHVRVGMEDNVYVYPDRDDLIESSADCVRRMVEIAGALGRPLATLKEAEKMLGLPKLRERVATAARR